MSGKTEGVARSVHDRLVRHAKAEGLDPTLVFTRYGLERFLFRLGRSEHADRFILKGALLLFAWLGEIGRTTRDADLLGLGDLSDEVLLALMRDVCGQPVDADGMSFDPDSVQVAAIRVEDAYGGRRVLLVGALGAGRIKVQIDVGKGDATVPEPDWLDVPVILDAPAPRLRAYRPETVVAEKLHAIVRLGLANTRLKDFYDLVALARTRTFDGATLRSSIEATFERRKTELPAAVPSGLTAPFATGDRRRQWTAFVTRNELREAPELLEALDEVAAFIGPITWESVGDTAAFAWSPGSGWLVAS